MWAIVTVVEESTIAITNQLSHFNELGASLPQSSAVISHNPFNLQHRSHSRSNQVSFFLFHTDNYSLVIITILPFRAFGSLDKKF